MRHWSYAIWLIGVAAIGATLPARADTWRVDLIVFRYLGDADVQGRPLASPKLTDAIELTDTPRLSAAGITLLPSTDFALAPHWSSLRVSSQFRPLIKIAWTQNNPPSENGPRLHLRGGARYTLTDPALGAREVQEVDGTVGLNLSRFLHLDTELIFTEAGPPTAWWMLDERRRMRSEELHHVDSPRLGLIARVVKWSPVP